MGEPQPHFSTNPVIFKIEAFDPNRNVSYLHADLQLVPPPDAPPHSKYAPASLYFSCIVFFAFLKLIISRLLNPYRIFLIMAFMLFNNCLLCLCTTCLVFTHDFYTLKDVCLVPLGHS